MTEILKKYEKQLNELKAQLNEVDNWFNYIRNNQEYRKEFDDKYKALLEKWKSHVGENWYGFSLEGVPVLWLDIIDDFLEELNKKSKNGFKIHQIKLKFGGPRIYLAIFDKEFSNSIEGEIDQLEAAMYHEKLIF